MPLLPLVGVERLARRRFDDWRIEKRLRRGNCLASVIVAECAYSVVFIEEKNLAMVALW